MINKLISGATLCIVGGAMAQSPGYDEPDEYIQDFSFIYTGDTTDSSWDDVIDDWEDFQEIIHNSFVYGVSNASDPEDLRVAFENYMEAYRLTIASIMDDCEGNVGFNPWYFATNRELLNVPLVDDMGDTFDNAMSPPSASDIEDIGFTMGMYSSSWGTNETTGDPEFILTPNLTPSCLEFGKFEITGDPEDVEAFEDWLDQFWPDLNTPDNSTTPAGPSPMEIIIDCFTPNVIANNVPRFLPEEIFPEVDLPGGVMEIPLCDVDGTGNVFVLPPGIAPTFPVTPRFIPTGTGSGRGDLWNHFIICLEAIDDMFDSLEDVLGGQTCDNCVYEE